MLLSRPCRLAFDPQVHSVVFLRLIEQQRREDGKERAPAVNRVKAPLSLSFGKLSMRSQSCLVFWSCVHLSLLPNAPLIRCLLRVFASSLFHYPRNRPRLSGAECPCRTYG